MSYTEDMISYQCNIIVRLGNKIIGNIKESLGNNKGPYPTTAGYYYQPTHSKQFGDIFLTVAEVKRTLLTGMEHTNWKD